MDVILTCRVACYMYYNSLVCVKIGGFNLLIKILLSIALLLCFALYCVLDYAVLILFDIVK